MKFKEYTNPSDMKKILASVNNAKEYIIDGKEVDLSSIELDGIDTRDYPDFADAFIQSADFVDGTELNDHQLDELNSDEDLVYDLVIEQLH